MMVKFKLREVDGKFKPGQPWHDYIDCCNYVRENGGTIREAKTALFKE